MRDGFIYMQGGMLRPQCDVLWHPAGERGARSEWVLERGGLLRLRTRNASFCDGCGAVVIEPRDDPDAPVAVGSPPDGGRPADRPPGRGRRRLWRRS